MAAFSSLETLFSLLAVLALLVCDAAAGLARGLAGSLALAAAAVRSAGAKVPGLQGDDMFPFHRFILQKNMLLYTIYSTSSQAFMCFPSCMPAEKITPGEVIFSVHLYVLVMRTAVVPLLKQRFEHCGRLHIQIEEIDCKGNCKQRKYSQKNFKNYLSYYFHYLLLYYQDFSSGRFSRLGSIGSSFMTVLMKLLI